MFVELHLLQNFAPSNLNRDDTGAPKDCEFGGYRRARISSQCLKRAMRRRFREGGLVPAEHLAHRTKRLLDELADRLARAGRDRTQATAVAGAALRGAGLGLGDDGKTQYLLFLGEGEIERAAGVMNDHWDALSRAAEPPPAAEGAQPAEAGKAKKSSKDRKKAAKGAVPAEVQQQMGAVLDGGKAADLALFGRMLADMPQRNIDAACQVAHALSANRVSMEMDYYTAVDDLKPEDSAGADMIGTVEFNSSCFYRYANIDLGQLRRNLQGDGELAKATVDAFLTASVEAVPTGKQNGTAAHNAPSFILAVVRDHGLWSLANAFVQPVRPTAANSLVQGAVSALDDYWGKLVGVFGDRGIRTLAACLLDDAPLTHLADARVRTFAELVGQVMGAARGAWQPEAAR
jgi:CRISPR system Cascade subunit CasC